jgi:hypothetical protein
MPITDGASLNGLLSTPLVLPASIAGGLAALFVVLAVMALRRAGAGSGQRMLVPAAGLVFGVLAVLAVLDRLASDDRAADRRALLQRIAELSRGAVAPGTMLSCLDSGAGEAIENACEKAVFAVPQSAASAVAYTGARLTLLAEAVEFSKHGDSGPLEALSSARRAIELDRYGIVAHVLAVRDGCTVERCAAFALLRDSGTLKANFRVHAFDNYVERYVSAWNKAPDEKPVASAAPPPAVASASEPPAGHPVSSKYDFPSAASIPAVSIMNSEPPPPKDANAANNANAAAPAAEAPPTSAAKLPPKRPPGQAATPPAR